MAEELQPGLWNFTLAFRKHLFAAMSGGASVPFAALAIYLDNAYGKAIFSACALTAAWFAAFRVWRSERQRVIGLEQELADLAAQMDSDIQLSFEGKIAYEASSGTSLQENTRCYLFGVRNEGSRNLEQCQVQLRVIGPASDGRPGPRFFISGPFSLRPEEDKELPFIRSRVRASNNEAIICPFTTSTGSWLPSELSRVILPAGEYRLIVEVLSASTRAARMMLDMKCNGHWAVQERPKR